MSNFAPAKDDARLQRLLGLPSLARASSAAWAFGKYFKAEAASRTLVFVFPDTLTEPLVTRETVAIETPASLATSLMVHGAGHTWASAFFPSLLAQRAWSASRSDCRSSNRVIGCSLLGSKILKELAFSAVAQHSSYYFQDQRETARDRLQRASRLAPCICSAGGSWVAFPFDWKERKKARRRSLSSVPAELEDELSTHLDGSCCTVG